MGIDNVIAGDGVGLAITGMLVVFVGLILISLYIASLPRLFEWAQARRAAMQKATAADEELISDHAALHAAIAAVVHMELEREQVSDAQRITIQRDQAQQTWAFAGKMRTLSSRM